MYPIHVTGVMERENYAHAMVAFWMAEVRKFTATDDDTHDSTDSNSELSGLTWSSVGKCLSADTLYKILQFLFANKLFAKDHVILLPYEI
jgi:hypothetical protein